MQRTQTRRFASVVRLDRSDGLVDISICEGWVLCVRSRSLPDFYQAQDVVRCQCRPCCGCSSFQPTVSRMSSLHICSVTVADTLEQLLRRVQRSGSIGYGQYHRAKGVLLTAHGAVLFLYNSMITLDREVAYFWSTKPTGAALLFFANKWINIMAGVVQLASFASTKVSSINGTLVLAACS